MNETLQITIIQSVLHWEDIGANLNMFNEKINAIELATNLIVLPEMFNTGFSMAAAKCAETMDGPTIKWMAETAKKQNAVITGSLIIKDGDYYYNRLIWMQPDGNMFTYDKKHLFRLSQEQEIYKMGEKKLLVECCGWRIAPMICYDLRFPVWCRNRATSNSNSPAEEKYRGEYDVLLFVANWPERRQLAWRTLLQARAIENQAFVVGVNRVGNDGNEIYHSGDSAVIGPLGEKLIEINHQEAIHTIILTKKDLLAARRLFPFWKDADHFSLME